MWLKFLLWAILVGSIIMGYFGYQSGSATNAAIGIGVFILAAFALFFILKMLLKLGFFAAKIILILVLIAIIALAGLKGCQYLVNKGAQVNETQTEIVDAAHSEMFGKSLWQKIGDFFSLSKFGMNAPQPLIPATSRQIEGNATTKNALPSNIQGKVTEVRSGYLFKIGTHFVKLYGIDAPDPNQECYDKRGESYQCGHQSKVMLEKLILNKNVDCQVAGGDYRQNYIATCKIKNTDVGVGMVSAGWAVADRRASQVYIPYEKHANQKNLGLWAGRFVAPWQARQTHKTETHQQTSNKKGFWESLF
jgi:endonuclease YncB( thermonuclease family)